MSKPRQLMQLGEQGIHTEQLEGFLDQLISDIAAHANRLLIVPPDITRLHSQTGTIAAYLYKKLCSDIDVWVMPATGTHAPMTEQQCRLMFGEVVPLERILTHHWREDTVALGQVDVDRLIELSQGRFGEPLCVQVNRELVEGGYDLVLSLGQVVPHEVVGMANYTKNIMVGLGGSDIINKSHFLSAVYGVENILGTVNNPIRTLLDEVFNTYVKTRVNVEFIMTVVECDGSSDGFSDVLRGVFCGSGHETFLQAADLSRRLNIHYLDKPADQVVVYLDPDMYQTTWLGNKAIYRSRLAITDGGRLIVLAPGLRGFGEDQAIDVMIRKYGYVGTESILRQLQESEDLKTNLAAAAHLIQGASEGRFRVVYCPGNGVSQSEIEQVGYEYMPFNQAEKKYRLEELHEAENTLSTGEQIYFIRNPGSGLWRV